MLKLFDVIDASHTGSVDYSEFVAAVEAYSLQGRADAAATAAAAVMTAPSPTGAAASAESPAPADEGTGAAAEDAPPNISAAARVGSLRVAEWHANGSDGTRTSSEEEGPEQFEPASDAAADDDAMPEFACE